MDLPRFPQYSRGIFLEHGFTLIEPGTPKGIKLGLRLKDWHPDSFIARKGALVILPLLRAATPGSGAFGRLVDHLDRRGLGVTVSAPTGRFRHHLERTGWAEIGQSPFGGLWIRTADHLAVAQDKKKAAEVSPGGPSGRSR